MGRAQSRVGRGRALGTLTCLVELGTGLWIKGVAQGRSLRGSPRGDAIDPGIRLRLE